MCVGGVVGAQGLAKESPQIGHRERGNKNNKDVNTHTSFDVGRGASIHDAMPWPCARKGAPTFETSALQS